MSQFAIATNVRKATPADAKYVSNDPNFSSTWTPAMDKRLITLCQEMHMTAGKGAIFMRCAAVG